MSFSILIVDDSALIRRMVRSSLEKNENWRVCGEAENGQTAVEKVEELHPDVVILDLQMPVMNGLEAARQITLLAPKTALLMYTMHTSQQLLREARAVGIKDVVSKSDRANPLLAALNNICSQA